MSRQNRRSRRTSLGLELLEGRRVLSTVAPVPMTAPIKGALLDGLSYIDLQGKGHGSTTTSTTNPDVGKSVHFQGSANLSGLGSVTVTGSLKGTGFIANGRSRGTITLSNSEGTFSLLLEGPTTSGFQAPKSGVYSFSSSGGTGAFAKHFGNGTIQLTLHGSTFQMTFHGKPDIY